MSIKFQPFDKTQPPTDAEGHVMRLPENDRIAKYMAAAADVVEKHTGSKEGGACLRASAPILAGLFWVVVKVAPLYAWLFEKGKWVYEHAPKVLRCAKRGSNTRLESAGGAGGEVGAGQPRLGRVGKGCSHVNLLLLTRSRARRRPADNRMCCR